MKALVFGSLNIDYVYRVPHFVAKGETLSSFSLEKYCGGKGLNQAVALSRAGMDTWMAGAVGEDGDFLLEELRSAGVDTSLVCRGTIPTGHAIIQNSPDGDNAIVLFGGANRSVTKEQAQEVLRHFARGDLLLLQNEISSLQAIVSLARERGMRIALNPSPMDAPLIRELLKDVDLLLLNRVEAAQLLGEESGTAESRLEKLHEEYPEITIVLTLGEDGSLLRGKDLKLRQRAFPVRAVDTTGAGDTFTGFFLASLLQSSDAARALRCAAAAAALAVTRPGAAPSIPRLDEVLRMLEGEES